MVRDQAGVLLWSGDGNGTRTISLGIGQIIACNRC
jgi:hypothetical protein